jgi:hypothetical protein
MIEYEKKRIIAIVLAVVVLATVIGVVIWKGFETL